MGRAVSKRGAMDALANRLSLAVESVAEKAGNALRLEACNCVKTARRQEALRPLIDSLILLLDRIEREIKEIKKPTASSEDRPTGCGCTSDATIAVLQSFAKEIESILRVFEVRPMEEAFGEFDPKRQQVVSVEPTSDPELDGVIRDIVRRGYTWNGRVLRSELVTLFQYKEPENGQIQGEETSCRGN